MLREFEKGRSTREIAEVLGIAAKTVKYHMTMIYRAFGMTGDPKGKGGVLLNILSRDYGGTLPPSVPVSVVVPDDGLLPRGRKE